MDQATMTNHTLEIDGMSGDACVQKVKGALKDVSGVTTQSVKVGSATIGANQTGCDAACSAISGAGYKARENGKHGDTNGANRGHQKNSAGIQGGNQSGNSATGSDRDSKGSGDRSNPGNRAGDTNGSNRATQKSAPGDKRMSDSGTAGQDGDLDDSDQSGDDKTSKSTPSGDADTKRSGANNPAKPGTKQ